MPKRSAILRTTGQIILLVAVIHIGLLIVRVIASGDWSYLNLASILDLKLFFPNIKYDALTGLIGIVVLVAIWLYQYRTNRRSREASSKD